MTLEFSSHLPDLPESPREVVSGTTSDAQPASVYLVLKTVGEQRVFEIRYQHHCSPFKQATIHKRLLLAGHEGHFYIYDLDRRQNVLRLEMLGYFGQFYINDDMFYIADACGLFCINSKGEIIWRNSNLAIDGILVEKFAGNKIYGSGECDPPGGWVEFVLDMNTGEHLAAEHGQ